MRVRKAVWLPGVLVAIVVALGACGGSDATATPNTAANGSSQQSSSSLTSEESDYLSEVVRAEKSSGAIFQNFQTIFTQTYPVREALIAALLEAGVGTPFIEKTAILEALDPPERFREDHQVWLKASREMLRIDTEAAEAVEAGDLVRFAVLNGGLGGVNVSARISLSPNFCLRIGQTADQLELCTPDDSALSGEYQTDINELIRGFMPAFATSQGNLGFRLSLTPEELNEVMSETFNDTRNTFQGFASALESIDPPDTLTADHERLRTFSKRVVEIAIKVDRLGEEGDYDGARGELLKLEPAFCDARASFESEEFKAAIAILFVGGTSTCGGADF